MEPQGPQHKDGPGGAVGMGDLHADHHGDHEAKKCWASLVVQLVSSACVGGMILSGSVMSLHGSTMEWSYVLVFGCCQHLIFVVLWWDGAMAPIWLLVIAVLQ